MRLLATAAIAPLLALSLVACGSDGDTDASSSSGDSTSQESTGQDSGESAEGTAPDYPTDASIKDYCTAESGEDPETNTKPTVGDIAGYLQDGRDEIVRIGIPENFTETEQAAFDEQIVGFDKALDAIHALDQDKPATAITKDKEATQAFKDAIETASALKAYSKKNC